MFKIKCLNPISKIGMDYFGADYEVTEDYESADGVMVRSAAMLEMDLPVSLKAVARAGAGVNNIPLDRCAEKGIVVFNTPGANANGVKELVLAGLLLGARDIIGGIDWVKANKDDANIGKTAEKAKKAFAGNEIAGKKLGVLGLGAIGIKVANMADSLGMDVYGYDPYISVDAAWTLSSGVKHISNIDDIFATCDYITIHIPLMDATKKMINAEAFSKMKDGMTFLNFARDTLVDDEALKIALSTGKVKKYITDFPNAAVANMDNVIVIPHLGASTEEAEDNCAVMAAQEMIDYLENGNIKNSVNYPACNMGPANAPGRVTVCHKNIPNMIAQLTQVCAAHSFNINNMINKSRGDWAYTMLDLDKPATEDLKNTLDRVTGIVGVRIIK